MDVQVCFVAGTKIRLKNGEVKTIEELKKGWFSRAAKHDDPTGAIGDFEIVELYENETDRLVEILFENKSTGKRFSTKSTPEHPFFVYGKGWIAAKDMLPDHECRSASDQRITVVSVTELEETCKVYNFQVKSAHTYFVGENDDESVLVHNECAFHDKYFIGCIHCEFGTYAPTNDPLGGNPVFPFFDPPPATAFTEIPETKAIIVGEGFTWGSGDILLTWLGVGWAGGVFNTGGRIVIKRISVAFAEEAFSAATGLPVIKPKDLSDGAKAIVKFCTDRPDKASSFVGKTAAQIYDMFGKDKVMPFPPGEDVIISLSEISQVTGKETLLFRNGKGEYFLKLGESKSNVILPDGAIPVAHTHPSGNPSTSPKDREAMVNTGANVHMIVVPNTGQYKLYYRDGYKLYEIGD